LRAAEADAGAVQWPSRQQACAATTRRVDAGAFCSLFAGRRGRLSSSPPQFGQKPSNFCSAQVAQNVHSNEQINAFSADGGKSVSQHSQFGRSSSMDSILLDS